MGKASGCGGESKKLSAVTTRGTKRDFIDLYAASGQFGFSTILGWFARKYAGDEV